MTAPQAASRLLHLGWLETEAIHILREGVAQGRKPVMLFSEWLTDLPCDCCREPTPALRAEVSVCAGCGHRSKQAVEGTMAKPEQDPACNP